MTLFPEMLHPPGFAYRPDILSPEDEKALLNFARLEELEPVVINGYPGRRLVRHYGYRYDFERSVSETSDIPEELLSLRDRAAAEFSLDSGAFVEALLTKYPPGSTIGWHRDAPMFGSEVIGVSLLSPCRMRLRLRQDRGFQRRDVELMPRSAYLISGDARWKWQHSIPALEDERWSVTYRTVRRD